MSKGKRLAMAGLAAGLMAASVAYAQGPGQGQGPGGAGGPDGQRGPRMSAESMERMQEGRLAGAKAALKLSAEQEKLWAPVEQHIRDGWKLRSQRRDEWRQMREARRQGGDRDPAKMMERLEQASQRMTERAERMKSFVGVLKPLYATLDDTQKEVLGPVLREASGMHGRRFAHAGGHHGGKWGGHHGMMHHGGMRGGGMGPHGGMGDGMGEGRGPGPRQ